MPVGYTYYIANNTPSRNASTFESETPAPYRVDNVLGNECRLRRRPGYPGRAPDVTFRSVLRARNFFVPIIPAIHPFPNIGIQGRDDRRLRKRRYFCNGGFVTEGRDRLSGT